MASTLRTVAAVRLASNPGGGELIQVQAVGLI